MFEQIFERLMVAAFYFLNQVVIIHNFFNPNYSTVEAARAALTRSVHESAQLDNAHADFFKIRK